VPAKNLSEHFAFPPEMVEDHCVVA
jgi:hypothetical protein